jgi:hypothetical protein
MQALQKRRGQTIFKGHALFNGEMLFVAQVISARAARTEPDTQKDIQLRHSA